MKRIVDFAVAMVGVVVLSPLMAAIAVAIRLTMGSPILYLSERGGLGGSIFFLYKFRSMTDARGSDGNLLPDQKRLTRLGRILRNTSLDELPSLVNVLRGDMSLVGPRPLPAMYLERYSKEQARRHEVRPGITGLAQIHGRNLVPWEERLALDVRYVDTHNLRLDLQILVKTLSMVIRQSGVSAEGHATMYEFKPPPE